MKQKGLKASYLIYLNMLFLLEKRKHVKQKHLGFLNGENNKKLKHNKLVFLKPMQIRTLKDSQLLENKTRS